jgi:hypothetical protein
LHWRHPLCDLRWPFRFLNPVLAISFGVEVGSLEGEC